MRLRRRLSVTVLLLVTMGTLIGIGAGALPTAAAALPKQFQLYCTPAAGSSASSGGISGGAAPLITVNVTPPAYVTTGSSITVSGSIQVTLPAAFTNLLTTANATSVGLTITDIELGATGATPAATNLVTSAETNGASSAIFNVAQTPITRGSPLTLPLISAKVGPWVAAGAAGTNAVFEAGVVQVNFTAEGLGGNVITTYKGVQVSGAFSCYPQEVGDTGTDETTPIVPFQVPILSTAPASLPPAPTITAASSTCLTTTITWVSPSGVTTTWTDCASPLTLTIWGKNLTGAWVEFGLVPATDVTVYSTGTELTVKVPGTPVWEDTVSVSTMGGTAYAPNTGLSAPISISTPCAYQATVVTGCSYGPTTSQACTPIYQDTSIVTCPPATVSNPVGSWTRPVVSAAVASGGRGYWMVSADGGVAASGNASSYGDMSGQGRAAPVVGIAATPDGKGYWLVASDGRVFFFGDAGFFGSMANTPLAGPVVGIAATKDGGGYWLVASDGGVFTFGDAGFFGALPGQAFSCPANGCPFAGHPVIGLAPTLDGAGYWLAFSNGSTLGYGDAGPTSCNPPWSARSCAEPSGTIVAIAPTKVSSGSCTVSAYALVDSAGGAYLEGQWTGQTLSECSGT